jgi:UDP-N-acetylmuramate-alanine ligase
MEQLLPHLFTNYAHTPEKILGGMSTALELAKKHGKSVVIIYEPLTNRRQHHIKHEYKGTFTGAKKLYWVRTYLAREDPNLPLLTPADLINHLDDPAIAAPAEIDDALAETIKQHLQQGDMVVAMGASGGGSLDEWLRTKIKEGKL